MILIFKTTSHFPNKIYFNNIFRLVSVSQKVSSQKKFLIKICFWFLSCMLHLIILTIQGEEFSVNCEAPRYVIFSTFLLLLSYSYCFLSALFWNTFSRCIFIKVPASKQTALIYHFYIIILFTFRCTQINLYLTDIVNNCYYIQVKCGHMILISITSFQQHFA